MAFFILSLFCRNKQNSPAFKESIPLVIECLFWGSNLSNMKVLALIILASICLSDTLNAQVYTNKPVGEKQEALIDSLKTTPYPYALPIWGDKAAALGFDLPYPVGLGVNYFTQESELVIENLMVGFNGGPQYDIDEIIRFNKAIASANAVNFRPDVWILPFLNVYGILAKARTSTEIGAGIFLPDSAGVWKEIADFQTKAEFDATSVGFGITPTMGVAGGWLALDMNFVWTDVSALDKPVKTFVFGPRLGKTFKFAKPQRNIALWVGGFRVKFSSETAGSLPLNEVIPTDGLQEKVDNGIVKVGETQMQVDEWWSGLSNLEQNNPVNKAKYATANRVLETSSNILTGIDGALNDENTATVQYSLDKRVKDQWNFIVGSQFQLNKSWMVRAEYGFLGSRTQFLAGLQYRFGL